MNEDYLWDGTGECPEIEELERELAVFRIADDGLPFLPPVTVSPKDSLPSTGHRWRWLLPATALAGVVILGIVFGFRAGGRSDATLVAVKETTPQAVEPEKAESTVAAETAPFIDRTLFTREGREAPARRLASRPAPKRSPKAAVKSPETRITMPSREEKAAYDQLVLALSITGAKLRVVQEKTQIFGTPPSVR